MTYSATTVPTVEQDAYEANKPLILSHNLLTDWSDAKWTQNLDFTWAGITNNVDTEYPIYRVADNYTFRGTRSQNLSSGRYLLVFDMGQYGPLYYNNIASVDSIVIYPGNFTTISASTTYVDVRVSVADSPDFTGTGQTIANFRTNTDAPLVEHSLTNASQVNSFARVSAFRYLLLEFYTGPSGADFNTTNIADISPYGVGFPTPPIINEIYLGGVGVHSSRRGQLSRYPDVPYSHLNWRSVYDDSVSKIGLTNRHIKNTGRRTWTASFSPSGFGSTNLDQFGLNDTLVLADLWTQTRYGTAPFIWCPQPYTSQAGLITTTSGVKRRIFNANTYFVQLEDNTFEMALSGGLYNREVEMSFKETAPYLSTILADSGVAANATIADT